MEATRDCHRFLRVGDDDDRRGCRVSERSGREEVRLVLGRVGWPKWGGGEKGAACERRLATAQVESEGEGKVGRSAG
jgi:hypothetical protein